MDQRGHDGVSRRKSLIVPKHFGAAVDERLEYPIGQLRLSGIALFLADVVPIRSDEPDVAEHVVAAKLSEQPKILLGSAAYSWVGYAVQVDYAVYAPSCADEIPE